MFNLTKMLFVLLLILSTTFSIAGSKKSKVHDFETNADNTYRKFDNTLTIHVTSSPKQLDWSKSLRSVLLRIAANKYLRSKRTKRAIGHVTVELNCKIEGKQVHRFGGQGAKSLAEFNDKIIKEGLGLNLVVMPEHKLQYPQLAGIPPVTVTGKFESKEDLVSEYNKSIGKKDLMGLITYKIDESYCADLIDFFDEYKQVYKETKNTDHPIAANRYGFGADPLKFEGAGCAAFMGAFYQQSGLTDEYKNTYEYFYAPKKYFYFPGKSNPIKLTKILLDGKKLKNASDDSLYIGIPSPDQLYKNMKKTMSSNKDLHFGRSILEKGQFGGSKAFYLVIDATDKN